MKKIAILFTLLFTILGISTLNAMEPSYQSMPPELKKEIITTALKLSDNLSLDEAIKITKMVSVVWGIHYDNLNDFTRLAHLLANKFNKSTEHIAEAFKTDASKKYLTLNKALANAIRNTESIPTIIGLI